MTKHWPCITTFSTLSSHTGLKIKYADVIFLDEGTGFRKVAKALTTAQKSDIYITR